MLILSAAVVLLMVLHGIALWVLWGWFIVPLGLPAISMTEAIGLAAIAGVLTHHVPVTEEDGEGDRDIARFFYAILVPIIAVIVGWVVHFFR